MRGKKVKVTCKWFSCNNEVEVREADLKRGWGMFCSKSCSCKYREGEKKFYRDLKK